MKNVSFVRTIVPKGQYVDRAKVGELYLIHFDPVENTEIDAYECVECSVPASAYDDGEVQAAYEKWKEEQEDSKLFYAIKAKISEIGSYDTSPSVNMFTLNGQKRWIDAGLRNRISYATSILKRKGEEKVDIWFGPERVTLSCDKALDMLEQIEMYAKETNNVTHQHKVAVKNMKTLEEVDAFDIRQDYPAPLVFDLS